MLFGRKKKERQTAVSKGVIARFVDPGADCNYVVAEVHFEVNGEPYKFRERIWYDMQVTRAGKIPIGTVGMRPAWAEGLEAGSVVDVRYDPTRPKNASIIKGEVGQVE